MEALNRKNVMNILGLSSTGFWELRRKDVTFPAARRVGRRDRWIRQEVEAWLLQKN